MSEGLIRSRGRAWRASRWWSSGWLQAAAALVLFLGGTALGSRIVDPATGGDLAQNAQPPRLELVPVGSQALPVSNLSEAAEAVRLAERVYIDALVQYRQLMDSQGQPAYIGDPASRFAALEALVAAGRAAVQQAPADPFVNGVLVSALAERDALLNSPALTTRDRIY
jgi:hypothetical protein